MKLLFDHNLSHKLCPRLADLFPDSTQTRLLAFETASDQVVWDHAKTRGFVFVTLDKDFADLALLRGVPPKIIWLRCGKCRSKAKEILSDPPWATYRPIRLDKS